jgi:hypothetical protein
MKFVKNKIIDVYKIGNYNLTLDHFMFKLLIFNQTKKSLGARTTMDDLVFVFLLFVKFAFL